MTRINFTILFLLILANTFAQEHSKITIGAGYPFMPKAKVDISYSSYSVGNKNINIFIEKPAIYSFANDKSLCLTPGLAYFQFNESGSGGGLGGGSSKNLKHTAYSLYLKCLYQKMIIKSSPSKIYFGFNTGAYLHSETTGTRKWWASGTPNNSSGEVDEDGKHFFNSLYMGFIFGFQPFAKGKSTIKPIIEFSFYPNYATFYDPHTSEHEQKLSKNMFEISLGIGLGNKKEK